MSKRKRMDDSQWPPPLKAPEICPLCEREIPSSQRDEHHLIPKVKGGKETQYLHRICHRHIHAVLSESELFRTYNTVEALLTREEIRTFVAWVKSKPVDYLDGPKLSRRRR